MSAEGRLQQLGYTKCPCRAIRWHGIRKQIPWTIRQPVPSWPWANHKVHWASRQQHGSPAIPFWAGLRWQFDGGSGTITTSSRYGRDGRCRRRRTGSDKHGPHPMSHGTFKVPGGVRRGCVLAGWEAFL